MRLFEWAISDHPLPRSEIRASSFLTLRDETDLYRLSVLQQGNPLSIRF